MLVANRGADELYPREPGHELFEQDVDLQAGQGSSDTEVLSEAEAEISFVARPSRVEYLEGRRIVYCATSEAFAVLEVRVHVGRFIPRAPFAMHEIAIPDDLIHTLAYRDLPTQWNGVPHSLATQAKGDAWLAKEKHLALRVPSVHSQHDWTVLINPEHEAASQVRVVARRAYRFDPRLFERL